MSRIRVYERVKAKNLLVWELLVGVMCGLFQVVVLLMLLHSGLGIVAGYWVLAGLSLVLGVDYARLVRPDHPPWFLWMVGAAIYCGVGSAFGAWASTRAAGDALLSAGLAHLAWVVLWLGYRRGCSWA